MAHIEASPSELQFLRELRAHVTKEDFRRLAISPSSEIRTIAREIKEGRPLAYLSFETQAVLREAGLLPGFEHAWPSCALLEIFTEAELPNYVEGITPEMARETARHLASRDARFRHENEYVSNRVLEVYNDSWCLQAPTLVLRLAGVLSKDEEHYLRKYFGITTLIGFRATTRKKLSEIHPDCFQGEAMDELAEELKWYDVRLT